MIQHDTAWYMIQLMLQDLAGHWEIPSCSANLRCLGAFLIRARRTPSHGWSLQDGQTNSKLCDKSGLCQSVSKTRSRHSAAFSMWFAKFKMWVRIKHATYINHHESICRQRLFVICSIVEPLTPERDTVTHGTGWFQNLTCSTAFWEVISWVNSMV